MSIKDDAVVELTEKLKRLVASGLSPEEAMLKLKEEEPFESDMNVEAAGKMLAKFMGPREKEIEDANIGLGADFRAGMFDAKPRNSVTRFIDACVSRIAKKIEDEFDESKHARDDDGKFTSKGGGGNGDVEASKETAARINKSVDKLASMFNGEDKDLALKHLEAMGVDASEDTEWDEIEGDVVSAVTKDLDKGEEKSRSSAPEDDENDGEDDDRDEDQVRRDLYANLNMFTKTPEWMSEKTIQGMKKDMRKLGMSEEIPLLENKKLQNDFKKRAMNSMESIDENELEDMLVSAGYSAEKLRNEDIHKKAKQYVKSSPIEAHAALRERDLLDKVH